MVVYDLDQSYEKNLERMQVAGHTRFPLCYGSLDQCIGIIHIKDIFRLTDTARLAQPVKLKRMIAKTNVVFAYRRQRNLVSQRIRLTRMDFGQVQIVNTGTH